MTNWNKPDLDQIETNMFDATERYLRNIDKNPKYPSKSYGEDSKPASSKVFAANVKPKTRYRTCNLCLHDGKEASHEMYKCPNYLTPYKKVEKLKAIKDVVNVPLIITNLEIVPSNSILSVGNVTEITCHFFA